MVRARDAARLAELFNWSGRVAKANKRNVHLGTAQHVCSGPRRPLARHDGLPSVVDFETDLTNCENAHARHRQPLEADRSPTPPVLAVAADEALGRCAPSGPRSRTSFVRQTSAVRCIR
jgi:hypothetical protein